MFGQGMGYGMPATPPDNKNGGKKKSKRKTEKEKARRAERRARAAQLRNRQNYAIENTRFRRKVESIEGRGGIDTEYYRLPADRKQKKAKDYFFIMRKSVCFLMFLVLLVSVAYFVLGFVKIEQIPAQYTALFVETEKKAAETDEETGDTTEETGDTTEETGDTTEEAQNAASGLYNADATAEEGGETSEGETAEGEGSETEGESEEETTAPAFDGTTYGVLDPIFGFIKYVGNKLNMDLNFGESPLYDQMIAKVEVGMADTIAPYIILAFPVCLILYVISALIMMFKAFFGMFGKRIFKCFGLGAIFMIIFAAVTAFGGLAFTTDLGATMAYGDIVGILTGALTKAGGFSGGYGLLILLALPVLVLILSMFCRKKIPFSIFDTFGE